MVELGDKVKCKVTGVTGIAVAKTEFLNGCVQWEIQAKASKDGKIPEACSTDEQNVKVVKRAALRDDKEPTGGRNTGHKVMRGY